MRLVEGPHGLIEDWRLGDAAGILIDRHSQVIPMLIPGNEIPIQQRRMRLQGLWLMKYST